MIVMYMGQQSMGSTGRSSSRVSSSLSIVFSSSNGYMVCIKSGWPSHMVFSLRKPAEALMVLLSSLKRLRTRICLRNKSHRLSYPGLWTPYSFLWLASLHSSVVSTLSLHFFVFSQRVAWAAIHWSRFFIVSLLRSSGTGYVSHTISLSRVLTSWFGFVRFISCSISSSRRASSWCTWRTRRRAPSSFAITGLQPSWPSRSWQSVISSCA